MSGNVFMYAANVPARAMGAAATLPGAVRVDDPLWHGSGGVSRSVALHRKGFGLLARRLLGHHHQAAPGAVARRHKGFRKMFADRATPAVNASANGTV
jgi:hypothetical protein